MFFEALCTSQRAAAVTACGLIGMLYEARKVPKDEDGNVDAARRKELSLPILAALDRLATEERVRMRR